MIPEGRREEHEGIGAMEWLQYGCRLAWLIDPIPGQATIYRADGTVEELGMNRILSGEEVLPGFTFDLSTLRGGSV